MSTNYYHRYDICDCCGEGKQRHIGKSGAGWEFSFRGHNDEDGNRIIGTWEEWRAFLQEGKIFDEYGAEITLQDFVSKVMRSKGQKNHYDYLVSNYDPAFRVDDWKDPEGWSFSLTEFS